MPSLADLRRSWLLRMLGISNTNLSESDLMTLLAGNPREPYYRSGWEDPTGTIATSHVRRMATSSTVPASGTGRLLLTAIWIPAGATVNSITFWSGNTAESLPTNRWAALYDKNRNLLAVSSDKLTEAWAAIEEKIFTLTTPYVVPLSDFYYAGIVQVATTPVNFSGNTAPANVNSAYTILAGQSPETGLTTPASAPNPAGALGNIGGSPYVILR